MKRAMKSSSFDWSTRVSDLSLYNKQRKHRTLIGLEEFVIKVYTISGEKLVL